MANEKRLIDASDALEVLCNYCGVEGCCPEGGCAEYQKISKLSPVDAVEVVHGRWLPAYKMNWWMGTETIDGFTCNQCARYFKSKLRLNYCPNCGAKMDGERKEDGKE